MVEREWKFYGCNLQACMLNGEVGIHDCECIILDLIAGGRVAHRQRPCSNMSTGTEYGYGLFSSAVII